MILLNGNLVKKNRLEINKLFTKLKSQKKKIIALSTPAKGMTLINYCKTYEQKENLCLRYECVFN